MVELFEAALYYGTLAFWLDLRRIRFDDDCPFFWSTLSRLEDARVTFLALTAVAVDVVVGMTW